jgi:hypothetical protein
MAAAFNDRGILFIIFIVAAFDNLPKRDQAGLRLGGKLFVLFIVLVLGVTGIF